MDDTPQRQLVIAYLRDAHSIEVQALDQMRAAPKLAGDPQLAAAYEEHLVETQGHEQRVRERLEQLGSSPSKVKDLAGRAGALGMLLFARVQPDTPGKLAAHAYSYEHMELAAYELLELVARATGDEQTAQLARGIAGEEAMMALRLAGGFDLAADASLREVDPDDLGATLDTYLADAHALEAQAMQLLSAGPKLADEPGLQAVFKAHLEESRHHAEVIEGLLQSRGATPSRVKDAALRVGALNLGGFFGSQPDTTLKLAGFAFALEHIEVAGYELLSRVAIRAEAPEVAAAAQAIIDEERAMGEALRRCYPEIVGHMLERELAHH